MDEDIIALGEGAVGVKVDAGKGCNLLFLGTFALLGGRGNGFGSQAV